MRKEEIVVHGAIQRILDDVKGYKKSLNYAVGYCRYALTMRDEDLRVQCLYILNNIKGWRHEDAKDVRRILCAYVEGKEVIE